MSSALDAALQRALSIRLNLQISLSSVPMIQEWMDIHLDRWLEHNPMPPEMPDGQDVAYLAMLGSDLRRVWWGAWGDPRGFVPKMADYFKLCNIAKSDAQILDALGVALEPRQVGSWIGVWGNKVVTGWHFCDPQPWDKVEKAFGTHEAKFQLKKWIEDHKIEEIERFTQSIGDGAYSEVLLAVPGETVADRVDALSGAFTHFTGAPLAGALVTRLKTASEPSPFRLAVRIRGGKVVRVGGMFPGCEVGQLQEICLEAQVGVEAKLPKLVGALGDGISRLEYGRAGDRAGVDLYIEPSVTMPKPPSAAPPPPSTLASSDSN
jgi:hypothetical protein